jgi:plasmid stability protein
MADITIHGLDANALERLQRRADANKRSLEDEIRHILTWGVEYIERIQTLAAGMKPLEKPKPLNDEADPETLERRKALREHLRQGHEEYERLMQELDEEEAELGRLPNGGEK